MLKLRFVLVAVLLCFLFFSATSGRFLVVNNPERAEVIVVLAGETDRRPSRALELLSQSYAAKILIDVPATNKIYSSNLIELAQDYVRSLPQANSVAVCPTFGLSTKAETEDVARCLQQTQAKSVLLVTSDYHTRRALSIFHHELPQYQFSVAAVYDRQQFGTEWWQRRQWAKMNFDEWTRLVWWQMVDRWR